MYHRIAKQNHFGGNPLYNQQIGGMFGQNPMMGGGLGGGMMMPGYNNSADGCPG